METWTAAYKKGDSFLWWPTVQASDEKEASQKLAEKSKGSGYRYYGGPFPEKIYNVNK